MQKIILCADDYNQSPAISRGILTLVENHRLSAVGCFSTLPNWQTAAKELQAYQSQIDIGLHFNLTESSHFSSLSNVMLQAFLKRLDSKKITAILNEQLDRFVDVMGVAPNFIDGHQHIHHLPIIRDVLLEVYEQRLRAAGTYLRIANNGSFRQLLHPGFPKNLIIKYTGALQLKTSLQQKNIPYNTSFSGIYDFKKSRFYPHYFRYFLRDVENGGLIMCHPGLAADDLTDPIAKSRNYEYQYLMSDQFLQDCQRRGVELSRGRPCACPSMGDHKGSPLQFNATHSQ